MFFENCPILLPFERFIGKNMDGLAWFWQLRILIFLKTRQKKSPDEN